MAKLDSIKNAISEHKVELKQSFGIKSIGIFGSYVRGEAKKGSDLDVLVDYDKTPGLFEFVELKYYLSDVLGINVDLVMRNALKPAIGKHILEEVVMI